jgi:hypothetical protein
VHVNHPAFSIISDDGEPCGVLVLDGRVPSRQRGHVKQFSIRAVDMPWLLVWLLSSPFVPTICRYDDPTRFQQCAPVSAADLIQPGIGRRPDGRGRAWRLVHPPAVIEKHGSALSAQDRPHGAWRGVEEQIGGAAAHDLPGPTEIVEYPVNVVLIEPAAHKNHNTSFQNGIYCTNIQHTQEHQVKVWVQRRLDGGAALDRPEQIGEPDEPLELVVLQVTDQGQRRPTKVARLIPSGQRRAIDELVMPRLFWFKGGKFVLSGVAQVRQTHGVKGYSQSWLCQLALPAVVNGFKVVPLYRYGEQIARRELTDRHVTTLSGKLSVACIMDQALGRATVRADIGPQASASAYGRGALLDANLEWMSTDGFELSGYEHVAPHADRPATTLQQGWLCKPDWALAEQPEPARPYRAPREER